MAKFGLYTNQGERITITEHKDIKEALEYHSKLKQLPLDLFVSMFVVKEIKSTKFDKNGKLLKNETRSTKD